MDPNYNLSPVTGFNVAESIAQRAEESGETGETSLRGGSKVCPAIDCKHNLIGLSRQKSFSLDEFVRLCVVEFLF